MTTARKAELVREAQAEFGLGAALSALDLPRSTWYYQSQRQAYEDKHRALKRPLLAIAQTFPEYGYRRATDDLSERLGRPINTKVVRRLAKLWGLTQLRRPRAPRASAIRRTIEEAGERANLLVDLEDIELFEVLLTDFTELVYARGKAWLMPILDSHSKLVPGCAVGRRRSRRLALKAWARARRRLRSLGVSIEGVIMHHDRDSVYTSDDWVRRVLLDDRARLSYALRGARDNPDMESFNGRFKTENQDLFGDVESFEELVTLVGKRMSHYNCRRKHSSIGNTPPMTYVRRLLAEE